MDTNENSPDTGRKNANDAQWSAMGLRGGFHVVASGGTVLICRPPEAGEKMFDRLNERAIVRLDRATLRAMLQMAETNVPY